MITLEHNAHALPSMQQRAVEFVGRMFTDKLIGIPRGPERWSQGIGTTLRTVLHSAAWWNGRHKGLKIL